MIDYFIVSGDNTTALSKSVKLLLKEGWQLHGSPYAIDKIHYQALIKKNSVDYIGPR